jgi:hypothetical protein
MLQALVCKSQWQWGAIQDLLRIVENAGLLPLNDVEHGVSS